MMTTSVKISETGYLVRVTDYQDGLYSIDIINKRGNFAGSVVMEKNELVVLARALLEAAGVQPVLAPRGLTSADFGADNSLARMAVDPDIQKDMEAIRKESDNGDTDL